MIQECFRHKVHIYTGEALGVLGHQYWAVLQRGQHQDIDE